MYRILRRHITGPFEANAVKRRHQFLANVGNVKLF